MEYVIINLYLPCVGTTDRYLIIENIFLEVTIYLEQLHDFKIIVGGDVNS